MRFHKINNPEEFPNWTNKHDLTLFLHNNLKPYEDTVEDIERGLDYALSTEAGKGGFVLLAEDDNRLVGALVMLRTGMKGYVPENLLLFVAVDPAARGNGIGRRLCETAIASCDGDISLHVEYDNPAKRLYERIGFKSKYAEMRYEK
ncbi:MAG: GNAT family N-acetyltransferase [Armatimonadetes bacterium]|nr:GNAT family N-acetyltransferase [Armatimonadota bacterium]